MVGRSLKPVRSTQARGGSAHASYDRFFKARSSISRVQFWGLVALGGNLMVLGLALLVAVAAKLVKPNLDPWEGLILLMGIGICGSIVYLGFLHLRRAFIGRNGKYPGRG